MTILLTTILFIYIYKFTIQRIVNTFYTNYTFYTDLCDVHFKLKTRFACTLIQIVRKLESFRSVLQTESQNHSHRRFQNATVGHFSLRQRNVFFFSYKYQFGKITCDQFISFCFNRVSCAQINETLFILVWFVGIQ